MKIKHNTRGNRLRRPPTQNVAYGYPPDLSGPALTALFLDEAMLAAGGQKEINLEPGSTITGGGTIYTYSYDTGYVAPYTPGKYRLRMTGATLFTPSNTPLPLMQIDAGGNANTSAISVSIDMSVYVQYSDASVALIFSAVSLVETTYAYAPGDEYSLTASALPRIYLSENRQNDLHVSGIRYAFTGSAIFYGVPTSAPYIHAFLNPFYMATVW